MTENPKRREPNFPQVREIPPLRYWMTLAAVMMSSGTVSGVTVWALTNGDRDPVEVVVECVAPTEHAFALPPDAQ